MQISVFIATSLDGFIARANGAIDWLDAANKSVPAGEDFGYQAFFDSVDVLVMGRNTFDLVKTFPTWHYGAKRVIVLSRRGVEIPPHLRPTVSTSDESPVELLARLQREGVKRVYLDGGQTIQGFLRSGLVDDLTITLIPVLIGGGIPLFSSLAGDIHLRHLETKSYSCGFVQNRYAVVKQA
jgi:dihydrofolate reductase